MNRVRQTGDASMAPSWEQLENLRLEHGDAFYLLDVPAFTANLIELRDTFRRHYPNTSLAYSYKTNYIPDLCLAADRLDVRAEVVSAMEYDLARRVGVEPSRILFNGPAKTAADVERAVREGAVVNLDSLDETEAVVRLAGRHRAERFAVGLRCHVTLEGAESRFGLDEASGALAEAVARLRACGNVELAGLHCHVSAHRQVAHYQERARRLLELHRRYAGTQPMRFLDIGGGFFGKMPDVLRAQFREPIPTWNEYATGVGSLFAEAFPGGGPELILEPGTAVVADTMTFVARIESLKRIDTRRLAVTAGSVQNIKPYKTALNLPCTVVTNPTAAASARTAGPFDVMGYTCMEDDYLFRGYPGELGPGDFVLLENVGAYTVVFQPPFIRPSPAVLRFEGTRLDGVARRRGGLEDILAGFREPGGPPSGRV